MAANVAHCFNQKIGSAVDHLRLIGELCCGIDETDDFYKPRDFVEVAGGSLGLGEKVYSAKLCCSLAFIDTQSVASSMRML